MGTTVTLMKRLAQSKFAGSFGQTTELRKPAAFMPAVETAPVITARALVRAAESSADIMKYV